MSYFYYLNNYIYLLTTIAHFNFNFFLKESKNHVWKNKLIKIVYFQINKYYSKFFIKLNTNFNLIIHKIHFIIPSPNLIIFFFNLVVQINQNLWEKISLEVIVTFVGRHDKSETTCFTIVAHYKNKFITNSFDLFCVIYVQPFSWILNPFDN